MTEDQVARISSGYRDERDRAATAATLPSIRLVHPPEWEGVPVPDRKWIVADRIPAGTITLLSGDGGTGKTTAALQLAAARALGRDWFACLPTTGRTLVLSAEDDSEEMHRRLNAIREHYGARFEDLADVQLVDLVGQNAVLGELQRNGTIRATPLMGSIARCIEDFNPSLVIVDALADAFAGDENNRGQARQFINLLKEPAREYGCAFLVLSHPSLTGMSSGSGSSGSTAWSNSVRSRLYFDRAKATDGSEPDPDLRTLSTRKANYGPVGDVVTVRWERGAWAVQTGPGSLDKMAMEHEADDAFLTLLRLFNRQGQDVSAKRGPTYAPSMFGKHPERKGIGNRMFETAMQRLLASNTIQIETSGPPSRRRSRLVVSGEE